MTRLHALLSADPSKSTRNFISIYISLTGLATFILVLLPSWFGYKSSEAISFYSNDGWCKPEVSGIGVHCFGDFYYTILFANLDDPWSGNINPYPPVTIYLYKFFAILMGISEGHLALIVYLALTLIPLIIMLRHSHLNLFNKSAQATSFLALILFSSSPILVSIDRGNNVIFALPMLYFFSFAILKNKSKQALLWGICLTILKPQLGVFILIFVIQKQWSLVFKWIGYVSLGYFVGFALYFKSFPRNIGSWITQIFGFPNYGPPGSLFPVNLSFSNLLEIPFRLLGHSVPTALISFANYSLFILSVLILVTFGSKYSLGSNIFVLSLFPIIFVSTSFHYYLILLIVPLLLIVWEVLYMPHSSDGPKKRVILFDSTIIRLVAGSTVILTFIPWAIPYSLSSKLSEYSESIIGVQWLPSQILLNVLTILLIWRIWICRSISKPRHLIQPQER